MRESSPLTPFLEPPLYKCMSVTIIQSMQSTLVAVASCWEASQVPVLHSSNTLPTSSASFDQTSSSCLHQPSITSVEVAHFSNTPSSVIIEDDGLLDLPSTTSLQALQSISFVHVDLTERVTAQGPMMMISSLSSPGHLTT